MLSTRTPLSDTYASTIKSLMKLSNAKVFHDEIKKVSDRLDTHHYTGTQALLKDLENVWTNAIDAHGSDSTIAANARLMRAKTLKWFALAKDKEQLLLPDDRKGRTKKKNKIMYDNLWNLHSDIWESDRMRRCFTTPLMHLGKYVDAAWFRDPVDTMNPEHGAVLNLARYRDIITTPMDISTVQARLAAHHYANPRELFDDIDLIWTNAVTYNGSADVVGLAARRMRRRTMNMMIDVYHQCTLPPKKRRPTM